MLPLKPGDQADQHGGIGLTVSQEGFDQLLVQPQVLFPDGLLEAGIFQLLQETFHQRSCFIPDARIEQEKAVSTGNLPGMKIHRFDGSVGFEIEGGIPVTGEGIHSRTFTVEVGFDQCQVLFLLRQLQKVRTWEEEAVDRCTDRPRRTQAVACGNGHFHPETLQVLLEEGKVGRGVECVAGQGFNVCKKLFEVREGTGGFLLFPGRDLPGIPDPGVEGMEGDRQGAAAGDHPVLSDQHYLRRDRMSDGFFHRRKGPLPKRSAIMAPASQCGISSFRMNCPVCSSSRPS